MDGRMKGFLTPSQNSFGKFQFEIKPHYLSLNFFYHKAKHSGASFRTPVWNHILFYKYGNGSALTLTNQSSQRATLCDVDLLNLEYDGKGPGTESQPTAYVNLRQCGRIKHHRRVIHLHPSATPQQETERKDKKQKLSTNWALGLQLHQVVLFIRIPHLFLMQFASMASDSMTLISTSFHTTFQVLFFLFLPLVTWPWPRPSLNLPRSQRRTNIFGAKTKGTSMFLSGRCV